MQKFVLIAICILLVVAGQLLLKYGMIKMGPVSLSAQTLLSFLIKVITSPLILVGLALYFVSSMVWLILVSREELSFIQPLTALVYVFIVFSSWLLFKEQIGALRIFGVGFISVGVFLVAKS